MKIKNSLLISVLGAIVLIGCKTHPVDRLTNASDPANEEAVSSSSSPVSIKATVKDNNKLVANHEIDIYDSKRIRIKKLGRTDARGTVTFIGQPGTYYI